MKNILYVYDLGFLLLGLRDETYIIYSSDGTPMFGQHVPGKKYHYVYYAID